MLGDDRFRKAARVVDDDAKNDEGTYASDSDAALAQSARAALVPFVVFIMACIRLSGRSPNDRRWMMVSVGNLVRHSCGCCGRVRAAADRPKKISPGGEEADLYSRSVPGGIEVGQRCRSI